MPLLPLDDEGAHKRLDSELQQLLQSIACPSQRQHTAIKSRVLHILAGLEGTVIPHGWKSAWMDARFFIMRRFSTTLKDELKPLHAAFTAMVRYAIDATTSDLEDMYAQLMAERLNHYLFLRGHGPDTQTGQLPTTATRQRRRRRTSPRKPWPLTEEQTEAYHLVTEHKGNVTAAAKVAGKSRQAMRKLYKKAMKKLGQKAVKHGTQALPTDRRGQCTVADDKRS
jgi:hypothetical protein